MDFYDKNGIFDAEKHLTYRKGYEKALEDTKYMEERIHELLKVIQCAYSVLMDATQDAADKYKAEARQKCREALKWNPNTGLSEYEFLNK